ncbi:hypothetical protein KP509_34G056700 [Ceratopteris richardii]|uniref:RING-type domain-containing protein n=1 Tax=Ceratopteris richardii TaxID=49495 RepID=A0A8T2QKQ0_CERRI|nr:hypothetical protein KP509_34G056700 [Ceratopteris richardii]
MGFIVHCGSTLSIVISILIIVLRDICIQTLEMFERYRESYCYSSINHPLLTEVDSFEYRHSAMDFDSIDHAQVRSRSTLRTVVYEETKQGEMDVSTCYWCEREPKPNGSSMDCSVCLCEFEKGQKLCIMPTCSHAFHGDCIYRWLDQDHSTCPLCRAPLLTLQMSATDVGDDSACPPS